MTHPGIGLNGLRYVQFAFHSLEQARRLFAERLGMPLLARSTEAGVARTGQRSVVYGAGVSRIMVTQPVAASCHAARYLQVHPEGVMAVALDVEDAERSLRVLEERGGTPVADIATLGSHREFDIATPLGALQYRFVQAPVKAPLAPELEEVNQAAPEGAIPWFGIDHITSNTRTIRPVIDWYRQVLGLERFWDVEFHTTHTREGAHRASGSGLRSMVMWCPRSGVKFATNESLRPFFENSQVDIFVRDNRGPGVQHVAFAVPSIITAVDKLEDAGFKFLAAPAAYYERCHQRLKDAGCDPGRVKEPLAELQKRGILLDGSADGYMLQIFQADLKRVQGRGDASPGFFEVIQRAGDRGFGYGNFRALFEALEAVQEDRRA